jgi:hypothetical protein
MPAHACAVISAESTRRALNATQPITPPRFSAIAGPLPSLPTHWNTFRDHWILEHEIPKWDGDLGQPNLYVPISAEVLRRKIELLNVHFGSQRSKQWFDSELFLGLARLRGMEPQAPERYAEAFLASVKNSETIERAE